MIQFCGLVLKLVFINCLWLHWFAVLDSHEFVLVNFYTDWCGFSRMLAPIYEEAAQKLKQNFPVSASLSSFLFTIYVKIAFWSI